MYDRTLKYIIGLIVLLACAQTGLAYIFTGNEIIDLNSTGNTFIKESLAWSATRLYKGTILSAYCGDTMLVGGFQVLGTPNQGQQSDYFQRIFTNLPSHTMIRFTLTVWAVDSWDPGSDDGFYLTFDKTAVDGLHIPFAYHNEAICGIFANDWKELRNIRIRGQVPHSGPTLVFKVNPYLDEDSNNESVGFRDVNFIFVQGNTTTPGLCGIAGSSFPKGQCSCPEGQYVNGTNVNGILTNVAGTTNTAKCLKCHDSCSSCSGPTEADCFSCKKTGYGWDGTKCVKCAAGCYTCNGAAPNVCLPCALGQIYYPEVGICQDYCDYPLQLTTTQYGQTCTFPCSANQYVNNDQTCSDFCAAPNQILLANGYYKLCLN